MSASACFGAGIGQKNRVTDAAGDRGKDAQAVVKPEPVKPKEDPVWRMGLALVRDGQNSDVLGKLNRYEAGLFNAFTRTLRMILVLQGTESERDQSFQPVLPFATIGSVSQIRIAVSP